MEFYALAGCMCLDFYVHIQVFEYDMVFLLANDFRCALPALLCHHSEEAQLQEEETTASYAEPLGPMQMSLQKAETLEWTSTSTMECLHEAEGMHLSPDVHPDHGYGCCSGQ